jgi:alpha-tubulin suppressor-like RCC1 family protein
LNTFGEVGNGQNGTSIFVPDQVCGTGQTAPCTQFIDSVSAVAAGGFHSLAVDGIGTVWGWGLNQSGQVGTTAAVTTAPVRNTPLFAQLHQQPGSPVATAVAAGANHSLALDSRGVVWGWGDNGFGQLGNGTFSYPMDGAPYIAWAITFPEAVIIVAIACGARHSLALDNNGFVWAWGLNDHGQLGISSFEERINKPTKLIHFPPNTRIVAIAGGASHSLAIDSAGRVWAWGANLVGQLGNLTNIDTHGPSQVQFPPGTPRALSIAAGGAHSHAVDANLNLWAWGLNANGQLGNPQVGNTNAPVRSQFPNNTHIVSIAAGSAHSIALESRAFFFGLEAVVDLDLEAIEARVVPQSQSSAPITVKVTVEGDERRRLLSTSLTDTEGHKLVFTMTEEKHDRKLILESWSVQYNGGANLSPGPNRVEYEVHSDRRGKIRELHQHLWLHSPSGRLKITGRYDADRGVTAIYGLPNRSREITKEGIALIRIGTMNGTLAFSDGTETWQP